jgi:tyrosinase
MAQVSSHSIFGNGFVERSRYALWTYETALIDECDYRGAQPYWDWSLDTSENGARWEDSPLFDPVNGFGGNSRSGSVPGNKPAPPARDIPVAGDCIQDGPFENYKSTFGTGFSFDSNPHCIVRNFNASVADSSLQWQKNIYPLLEETNFTNFTIKFDNPGTGAPVGIHGGGHSGVGGEVRVSRIPRPC